MPDLEVHIVAIVDLDLGKLGNQNCIGSRGSLDLKFQPEFYHLQSDNQVLLVLCRANVLPTLQLTALKAHAVPDILDNDLPQTICRLLHLLIDPL